MWVCMFVYYTEKSTDRNELFYFIASFHNRQDRTEAADHTNKKKWKREKTIQECVQFFL